MRKIGLFMAGVCCLAVISCGNLGMTNGTSSGVNVLDDFLGTITNGNTVVNTITSVIGMDKITGKNLVGNWYYEGPGVAFTSENLLAKAGGEVAASQIEEKLKTQYAAIGISSSNTYIQFAEDGKFSGKLDGKSLSGTYTLDEGTGALKLQTLLFSLNGYVKRNGLNGISVLFESKKLLTVLQTLAALSGNSTIEAVGKISQNYDGIRIGFDMIPR